MAAVNELQMVSVERLQPNPWNTNVVSPENEARIEASIKRLGFFRPIIVRTLEGGELEIIGGEHRWAVATRLGMTEVPVVNLGAIDDQKAKEIGLVDNGRYGEDDTLQLAKLLKELGSTAELSTFMPYSDIDFNNIFAASSIDLDDLGLSDEPPTAADLPAARAAPTHQVMRFKVPVEDVAWITDRIEQEMRTKNYTSEDSLTNAGNALVDLLKPPTE